MSNKTINKAISEDYKYGFETNIEQDTFDPGLNEDIIHQLSKIKNEPNWLLKWRLKAYKHWKSMEEPDWANVQYSKIDYQKISYYSAPKQKKLDSLDQGDPEILKTYDKLGIALSSYDGYQRSKDGSKGYRWSNYILDLTNTYPEYIIPTANGGTNKNWTQQKESFISQMEKEIQTEKYLNMGEP